MSPAFSSARQAAAFALLLAVLLTLPALVAKTGWLDRGDVYPAIAWKYGAFPWIQQKIFAETKDVDMAFLGSSHIWAAVDTPYVQKKLTEQLGRDAEVFTLGWAWQGFDALYIIARDLLDHRHVHTLVIDDEGDSDVPHLISSHWFRIGENSEVLAGLPRIAQARLYGSAVLGMPRQLLSFVRPNLLEDPARCHANFWNLTFRAPNLAEQRGALSSRLTYDPRRPLRPAPNERDFFSFRPAGQASPADVLVYSAENHDAFKFTGPRIPPYQLHFARKLARLCQERGTRLVLLHTPSLPERGLTVISERHWPDVLGAPVSIIGIPPAKLFAGIPTADVPELFFNDAHFNQNGQDMFTQLITPALLKQYATSTNRW
jgi:hypothetical protein